jgi:rhodanese-related sulfurtransferase
VSVSTVTANQFAELSKSGQEVDLIDVRTPVEFREFHIQGARNVPLDQLDVAAVVRVRRTSANEPLYVICRSGGRGKKACEKFIAAGYTNVLNIEGGTVACIDAGLPVIRGKKVMSLERQVRIAAGFIVTLGVVSGWLIHPAFLVLAAFVGAGLIFSGVTDTCGMGMLLAWMPWNRATTTEKVTCTR